MTPDMYRQEVPWPITSRLVPGQSLQGWLELTAQRNRLSLNELLSSVDIPWSTRPHALLTGLSEGDRAPLAQQSGAGLDEIHAATLDAYVQMGLVRPFERKNTASYPVAEREPAASKNWLRWRRWARAAGSRFCPQCLIEDEGRWQLRWHLSWAFTCTRHNLLLADRCPVCALVPHVADMRGSIVPATPWQCCHRRSAPKSTARSSPDRRCGADLRTAAVPALDPTHPVVMAQQWIDRTLDLWKLRGPSATVRLCGLDVPVDHAFDAVGAVIGRFASAGSDLSIAAAHILGPGHRIATGLDYTINADTRPIERMAAFDASTARFGIAAAAALDTLLSPTLKRAAEVLERFDDLRTVRGPDRQHGEQALEPMINEGGRDGQAGSTLLDAIVLTQRAPSMTTAAQLSFRTMSAVPRYPLPNYKIRAHTPVPEQTSPWPNLPGRTANLSARCIPQRMWQSVTDTLPRPGRKDTGALERAMSMALARMGTFQYWSTLAVQFQLPERSATSIQRVFESLRDHGMLEETLYVLDAVAEALLREPPPIDYARRRWVYRNLDSVGRGFRGACREHGVIATDRRRRFCGMLLWEILTGGDVRLRPQPLAPHSPADRTAFAEFKLHEGQLLRDFMMREAERQLLRHRIDEPIQWQPNYDPDTRTWRSPPPDKNRQLDGWTSPSRLGTLRQHSRDHTANLWCILTDEIVIDAQELGRLTCGFSNVFHSSVLGELLGRHGQRRQTASGGIVGRHANADLHESYGPDWPVREIWGLEEQLRRALDWKSVLIERLSDGTWALTESGQFFVQQIELTCPNLSEVDGHGGVWDSLTATATSGSGEQSKPADHEATA